MTAAAPQIVLRTGADLVAAVPHLLGYHPEGGSLIVVALTGHKVGLVQRVELPGADVETDAAVAVIGNVVRNGADRAYVVVIGGTRDASKSLVWAIETAAVLAGVGIVHALWAAGTRGGDEWACYDDTEPDCRGVAADPDSSVLAAALVIDGKVTYGSREEMAAQLAPTDPPALLRRALALRGRPPGYGDPVAAHELVCAAVTAAAAGQLPSSDEQFVDLAAALTHLVVRDAAMGAAHGPHAQAAQDLWVELVRGTPPPHRAIPAVLLACAVWQRGDGALATVAVANALTADPTHSLAGLLHSAIEHAMTPDLIEAVTRDAAGKATELLGKARG